MLRYLLVASFCFLMSAVPVCAQAELPEFEYSGKILPAPAVITTGYFKVFFHLTTDINNCNFMSRVYPASIGTDGFFKFTIKDKAAAFGDLSYTTISQALSKTGTYSCANRDNTLVTSHSFIVGEKISMSILYSTDNLTFEDIDTQDLNPYFKSLDSDSLGGIPAISYLTSPTNGNIPPALVYASPSATNGTASFRALLATDLPALSAGNISSGILSSDRGGTGLSPAVADANKIYAVNDGGTGNEFKSFFAGSGISIDLGTTGVIAISASGPSTINANQITSGTLDIARFGTYPQTANVSNTLVLRESNGNINASALILGSGSGNLTLKSASSSPQNFIFPSSLGSTGQFLTTDGSGATSWSTPSLGTIPVANGGTGLNSSAAASGSLLIGNGSGFTLGTLEYANGILGSVASGKVTISSNGSTTADANKLVIRDGTGGLQATQVKSDSLFLNNGFGAGLTLSVPLSSSYSLSLPNSVGNPGQVLKTNGTSASSWTNPGVSNVNGAASAPAFTFASNTSLGFYHLNGSLGFATGGTQRILMSGEGINISVNSTANYPLIVSNITPNRSQVKFGAGGYLTSISDDSGGLAGGIYNNGAGWVTSSTSASMVAANSGGVSIMGSTGMSIGSTVNLPTLMQIKSTGEVGIGTATPGARLHLSSGNVMADAYCNQSGKCIEPAILDQSPNPVAAAAVIHDVLTSSARYYNIDEILDITASCEMKRNSSPTVTMKILDVGTLDYQPLDVVDGDNDLTLFTGNIGVSPSLNNWFRLAPNGNWNRLFVRSKIVVLTAGFFSWKVQMLSVLGGTNAQARNCFFVTKKN